MAGAARHRSPAAVEFIQGSGQATVTGAATVAGSAGGVIDYVGSTGALTYYAQAGAETVNASGSSTNNVMWAGGAAGDHDVMIGGTGNDQLIAGPGANTLTGGGGADLFTFINGNAGGADVITDFSAGGTVNLIGYGAAAAAAAQQSAVVSGGNTVITLSDNTQITFLGVTSARAFTGHIVSS
jgi:Ca2+-binding RTX toxin-like protein